MTGFLTFFASCSGSSLFTILPTWYQYLPSKTVNHHCTPTLNSITDAWLIVAAIIDILLRIAALAAIAFVIYGGILYTTSQGSPDQTSKAKSTIINALIGLALSVSASLVVAFLVGQF